MEVLLFLSNIICILELILRVFIERLKYLVFNMVKNLYLVFKYTCKEEGK